MEKAENRKRYCFAACVVFLYTAIFFVYASTVLKITYFPYDSEGYWDCGMPALADGLAAYPITIRGCILPLLLAILRRVGERIYDEYFLFRFFYCLLMVLLLLVVLPLLLRIKLGTRRWALGGAISCVIFWYFWKDLVVYPLSDIPAVLLYLSVLLLARWFLEADTPKPLPVRLLAGFAMGLMAYSVYNTRTVYLIPLAVAAVIFLVGLVRTRRPVPEQIGVLLTIAAGMVLAALPQMIVNWYQLHTLLPIVDTSGWAGSSSLITFQLENGISIPRYETYKGDTSLYPLAAVRYYDPIGLLLTPETPINSITDFVFYFFKNFISACGLYFTHLISGITTFYREMYITDMTVHIRVFLLNVVLYLLALVGMMTLCERRDKSKWWQQGMWVALFLLPSLLVLPGAVETRYILPVYLLVYAFLTMSLSYREVWAFVRRHWFKTLLVTGFLFLCWCNVANNLLAGLEYGTFLFGGLYFPK